MPESMTFSQALTLMKAGKAVTRGIWNDVYRVFILHDARVKLHEWSNWFTSNPMLAIQVEYGLTERWEPREIDLLAEDWREVETGFRTPMLKEVAAIYCNFKGDQGMGPFISEPIDSDFKVAAIAMGVEVAADGGAINITPRISAELVRLAKFFDVCEDFYLSSDNWATVEEANKVCAKILAGEPLPHGWTCRKKGLNLVQTPV